MLFSRAQHVVFFFACFDVFLSPMPRRFELPKRCFFRFILIEFSRASHSQPPISIAFSTIFFIDALSLRIYTEITPSGQP